MNVFLFEGLKYIKGSWAVDFAFFSINFVNVFFVCVVQYT